MDKELQKKKKVVFILPQITQLGGIENMALLLINNLDKELFIPYLFLVSEFDKNNNILKNLKSKGIEVVFFEKKKGLNLKTISQVNRCLKQIKPDVIHIHNRACLYSSWYVLFHSNKNCYQTIHSLPQREMTKFHRLMMRILFHLRKVRPIAISDTIRRETASYYKLKEDQIPTIYNPVETIRFYTGEKYERFTFITAGRLSSEKNQIMMIEAINALHKQNIECDLLILGEGSERSVLQNKIQEYSLQKEVKLLGKIDNVEDYLAKSHVFLLTSRYEGLPLCILEAMAAGLPVVSSNVGGVPDIVKEGETGLLFEPDDMSALTNAMIQMVTHPETREYMRKNAIEESKKYDVTVFSKKYQDLFSAEYKLGVKKC